MPASRSALRRLPIRTLPALASVLRVALPGPATAQTAAIPPADSAALVKEAREGQRDFERFRRSRIPVGPEREEGTCDARIGRICIWFGGDDETAFPPEASEVALARRELIELLSRVGARVSDSWVLGERVRYLAESGALGEAERTARACGVAEAWWCSALAGYALHLQGMWAASEAAFREAAAALPERERKRWLAGRYILDGAAAKELDKGTAEERARRWELFWRLSDPLFLVEGNDRMTDHFARWVEARMQEDAEGTQGLLWGGDLEEALIRYGRILGWSRTQSPHPGMRPGGGFALVDTRQVVGHHHPRSRGYLFPGEFLRSPADIPPESWITAPREARSWYAPPYAPDFHGLETQVGRFRRGDQMLVVGAYRPSPAAPDSAGAAHGPVASGLFLVPEDGGPTLEARGSGRDGVFTLLAPPGRYVSSLEVLDTGRKRAWRARQGIRQDPLVPGLVAVSDLLVLEEDALVPETLEEALLRVRPGVRIRRGERFAVVWEVYGLRVAQKPVVTVGFSRGRPGFLARVGELAGILEPDRPVEITFEDAPRDGIHTAFRGIRITLPDLKPGDYTLQLRVALPGREPAVASRPIVVEG